MKKFSYLSLVLILSINAYCFWNDANAAITNPDQLRQAKQAKQIIEITLAHLNEELAANYKKYDEIIVEQKKENENQFQQESTAMLQILQSCYGKDQCKSDADSLKKAITSYDVKVKQLATRKNEVLAQIQKLNGECVTNFKKKDSYEKDITDYENELNRQKSEQVNNSDNQ